MRNPDKAELLAPLREQYGEKLWVVPLDVSDSASIKVGASCLCMRIALSKLHLWTLTSKCVEQEAAALVAQKVPAIDVLINNAGIGSAGGRISEE